jgi:hypothetical protein
MFDDIDKDGNGTIDYDEFRYLLRKLGIKFSNHEAKGAFRSIDRSEEDTIDREAFCIFVLGGTGASSKIIDHEYSMTRSKLSQSLEQLKSVKKELDDAEYHYVEKRTQEIDEYTKFVKTPSTNKMQLSAKKTMESSFPSIFSIPTSPIHAARAAKNVDPKQVETEVITEVLKLFSNPALKLPSQLEVTIRLLAQLEANTKRHQLYLQTHHDNLSSDQSLRGFNDNDDDDEDEKLDTDAVQSFVDDKEVSILSTVPFMFRLQAQEESEEEEEPTGELNRVHSVGSEKRSSFLHPVGSFHGSNYN